MSDRFSEALKHLGHVYAPRPEGCVVEEDPVRHIEMVFRPTGDVKPICGAQGTGLGCPQLWADSNCEECREIKGLTVTALTKRALMIDIVNVLCTIEQNFLDAMYWNFHNPEHEPINPDPDGELAKAWTENRMQIISMMERFQPTMEKHEGRFGWPTDLALPPE